MREYIFYVPEENEPIGDVYYPDERDDPMPVEPLVRCKDCEYCTESMAWPGAYECDFINRGVEPDGYCAWGERKAVE